MIEVIDGHVRYNGASYGVGETLTLAKNEEQRLVGLGVAKLVKEKGEDNAIDNKDEELDQRPGKEQGPNTSLPLE